MVLNKYAKSYNKLRSFPCTLVRTETKHLDNTTVDKQNTLVSIY